MKPWPQPFGVIAGNPRIPSPRYDRSFFDSSRRKVTLACTSLSDFSLQFARMESIEEMMLDYQKSAAYHEAAHEIVCIAQEIPIRDLGLRIDSKGRGVSHT